jgi:hypothetical protein
MQSILYNNKVLYNLPLINKAICNNSIRLDNLLSKYIRSEDFCVTTKKELKLYNIDIKTSSITFGISDIAFQMLVCEKSYLRNKIVDNVIKMIQGEYLIYELILISSGNFDHKEDNSQ